MYKVKLGFLESVKKACGKGRRVFTFSANGKKSKLIDVFAAVRCKKPYFVLINNVQVPKGRLTLTANRVKGFGPFLSNVQVSRVADLATSSDPSPNPSKQPSLQPTVANTEKIGFFKFNVPPGWDNYNPSGLDSGVAIGATGKLFIPKPYRSQIKKAGNFKYIHPVAPGVYTITLGFVEFIRAACANNKRVFTVSVNGKSTSNIDVFKEAGCEKPLLRTVSGVVVPANGKLTISLQQVSGFLPTLSTIQITRANSVPPTTTTSPTPSKTPTPQSGGGNKVVFSADIGGSSDPVDKVRGPSNVFPNVFDIEGTDDNAKFSKHRYGADFSYVIDVTPGPRYAIALHFAESFMPACMNGYRTFTISAYDSGKGIASAKKIKNLDVFKEAGCRTAYTASIFGILVPSGKLAINFVASENNAMISAFDISCKGPKCVLAATPSPTAPPLAGQKTRFKVNLGTGAKDIAARGSSKVSTSNVVAGTANAPISWYRFGRIGTDFTFRFNLKPGAYSIILGFAEFGKKFCSEAEKRVFNVYVNDAIQLEGYDIYANAGCNKGIEVKLSTQTVGTVDFKPLQIRFASIVNFALINFIYIKPASKQCVPASDTGGLADGEDHAAHSVPGSYPPQINAGSPKSYVDSADRGFVNVRIDGGSSHSHFFDSVENIVGVITEYKWTIAETGKLVSKKQAFNYDFPLGTTRLKLSVVDNSCTTDEAETTVTVTGAIQPGQYCYYYEGLTERPAGGTLLDEPRPQFAEVATSASLGFPSFSFSNTFFVARCFFFLEVDEDTPVSTISVTTSGSGDATVYKGEDIVLDTVGSTSAETALPVGLTGFEVIYRRTSLTKPAVLKFMMNGKVPAPSKISHDRKTVLPIISGLTPADGPNIGGTRVKVSGFGLFQPLKVKFGTKTVNVLSGFNSKQFFVNSPPGSGVVPVKATTAAGDVSNSANFAYGSSCDSVKFKETKLTKPGGGDVDFLELPTCAAIGQDGKIYMGTLGATVQVLGYDVKTLKTTSHCYSKSIVDPNYTKAGNPSVRDFLGITFDPRDKLMRPYVSSSTLFWHDRGRVDKTNLAAWRNGAVDRMKPGSDPMDPKICMVYDKRIVSGLPVSNHDHSVNALLFTQGGDLLIAVGGFSNMGLPGYKLGGYWETSLSAAILIAKLSKPGFDGNIKYSNPNIPRLAKKVSGDVDLYSTGLRNTFAMTMAGSGEVYASDQGPNCSFGDTSSTCDDYDEAEAAAWDPDADIDWPGKVKHGWLACPYSIGRPDKMVHITPGSWYGHPNIQRGGQECAWIDPFDHKTADDKSAPSSYKKPMVTLKSSITALDEYRADHFCGKLRGNLIMSTYKGGKTYRMGVNGGTATTTPDEISASGGITFVENAYGDLIFPRLTEKTVFILRPDVATKPGLFIAGAVPFRHGKSGGTLITIGGRNFGSSPTVQIGGKNCAIKTKSQTEIVCTVPGNGGGLKTIAITSGTESTGLGGAVLYMTK